MTILSFFAGVCLLQVALKEDPSCSTLRSRFLAGYAILIAGVGAFCFGVVLLEAVMDNSTETPSVDLCPKTPL